MFAAATLNAATVYVALHILLVVGLAMLVVAARRRHRVGLGDGGNPEVLKAIRAHGNAMEQLTPTLVFLLLFALLAAPAWALHLFGAATLVARVLHASGLHRSAGVTLGRQAGMMITWTCFILAAFGLLLLAAR